MMWTSALKLFYDCFTQPITDTLQLNNRLGKKEILILSRGLKRNKEMYHYQRFCKETIKKTNALAKNPKNIEKISKSNNKSSES